MNIIILGAAGFIGTNMAIKLCETEENNVTLVDTDESYFLTLKSMVSEHVRFVVDPLDNFSKYDELLKGMDIVYHLVSTTTPTTSNTHISEELEANVVMSARLFESAIRCNVKRVVFISSGGTVYGVKPVCPIREEAPTDPISSYGIQKITIEKLLYLYNYMYGLDYRIIRLANPYGPYQRPNGVLGALTTFIYKSLRNEELVVYGDGMVIRDFIYIDDAIEAVINIANDDLSEYKLFNVGSGKGTSINEIIDLISKTLNVSVSVRHEKGRKVDVPVNYLDISRYEDCYGMLQKISIEKGIKHTADYMRRNNIV